MPETQELKDSLAIGRIVHYVLETGEHRPAIIVNVLTGEKYKADKAVNLQIFTDSGEHRTGNDHLPQVVYAPFVINDETTKKVNTWHWPERN